MPIAEAERSLAALALDPASRRACAPRFDELLVAVVRTTEATATVMLRSKKRGELRVVELARVLDRWTVAAENVAPCVERASSPEPNAKYPERQFHFVPGTGPAPEWVEDGRRGQKPV